MAVPSPAPNAASPGWPTPRTPSPPPPSPQPIAFTDKQYLVSDSQIVVSLWINALWGGLCIFGFIVLRGWIRGPGGVYQRRQELQDLFMRPPRLILGTIRQVWNWIMPMLAVSDADIVSCSGFDALIITRVLLIGLQMFTIMTLFGMVVLVPVYYTRGGVEESSASLGTMARLSVANVPVGSHVIVLPFAMTYVFIGYGCWVLLINCKCYAQLRMAYFTCLDALPAALMPDDGEGGGGGPGDAPSSGKAAAVKSTTTTGGGAAGAGTGTGTAAAGSGGAGPGGWARVVSKDASLELSPMQGHAGGGAGAAAAAAAAAAPKPGPLEEGLEAAEEGKGKGGGGGEANRLHTSGDISATAALGAGTMGLMVRHMQLHPSPEVPGGVAADEVPTMEVRSTWLNMANFFNPTLRMMLDYLDWQNPLQRTAARFGVHDLRLPALTSDEAPEATRLYGEKEPLLAYDNILSKDLRSDAAFEMLPPAALDEYGKESYGGGDGVSVPSPGSTSRAGPTAHGGSGGGGVIAAAVLPYWRPLQALNMMRRPETFAAASSAGGGAVAGGGEPVPAAAADAAGSPPALSSSSSSSGSFARLRRGMTSDVAADRGRGGGGIRGEGAGGGGATSIPAAPATAAAACQSKRPAGAAAWLRYSLRHCNYPRLARAATSVTPTSPAAGAAMMMHGMTDPRQPLLPGKRNVRLLQLLQVPVRALFPDAAAAGSADAASGAAAAAARLRCTSMRPAAVRGGDEEANNPVRLVNANHYTVLIKRVHRKLGPGIIDRWGATTYVAVGQVRGLAQWAAGGAKEPAFGAKASLPRLARASEGSAAAAAAASNISLSGAPAAKSASGVPLSRSTHMRRRDPRDMVATAMAVAAAAAAPPLHGRARVTHEVSRFFEMFKPPAERVYDPLSDVHVAETRGKKTQTAAAELPPAGGLTSQPGAAETAAAAANGAAAATGSPALAPPAASKGADGGAGAGEAKAAAVDEELEDNAKTDAEIDPNGAAVAAVLQELFPKSFQGLIPITDHSAVDKLVYRWDSKMFALANVVRNLERRTARQALHHPHSASHREVEEGRGGPEAAAAPPPPPPAATAGAKPFCCGCVGGGGAAAATAKAERLRAQAAKLREEIWQLEARIQEERERALRKPVGTAYFALFNNSQDAQMLAQCRRVIPPQGPGCLLSFDAEPAPAPEDVSWPALWSTSFHAQVLRRLAIVLPMAIIFAIPIGPLQGALSNLDVSLCGGSTNMYGISTNKLYVDWFCEPKNRAVSLLKSLVTGVLPSVLGLVWTAVCMPQLLYFCSSLSRSERSLSGQERQMQIWFFWYSLINTFLGAVLGGGVFSQLGTYLSNPSKVLERIGKALPNTANFFIQFCIARALFTNFVRLIWPHAGAMLTAIFRSVLRLGVPRSLHAAALMHMPPSSRATSYYNAILQVFMFGCAFAVVAPIILPCCWVFFLTGFFAYRYSLLYVYERNYESGGRMWPVLFDQMMGFLLLMELFSGAVFIVNQAWFLAGITWITLTPPLVIFWRYCSRNYLEPMHYPPLSVVASEPRGVRISPLVYMPPALRPGALGWYPEQGKVWEKYGIPKHW